MNKSLNHYASQYLNTYNIIFLMFVTSGIAGLMYQVLFSKALSLVFGSTSTATYTVLATYMGGMAIGAWVGGRIAKRSKKPIFIYGVCELLIAVFCAITPILFQLIKAVYIWLAADLPADSELLIVYRLLLGGSCLLVPTILMGITLPVLAKYFELQNLSLGRSVGFLYSANTVGAAVGALVTGYFILPSIGVFKTTLLAIALNSIIALAAFKLSKKENQQSGTSKHNSGNSRIIGKNLSLMAFILLGLGGVITLGLEVIYIHLLAVVAGNSTYAFSLMLFAFILGLFFGSEFARRLLQKNIELALLLLCAEALLVVTILFNLFIWDEIPNYFASFANYPLAKSFSEREFIRGLVCLFIMLPPAVCIGFIYTTSMECLEGNKNKSKSTLLGFGAALNTVGNIVGVLVTGFIILPHLGAFNSILILAALALILYVVISIFAWSKYKAAVILLFFPIIFLSIVSPKNFNYTQLASGANVYFHHQHYGEVIDYAESIDGGLTTVAKLKLPNDDEVLTLLTNGKFQGDNGTGREMKAQAGFAIAPMTFTPDRGNALVIGYGTGVSAKVIHDAKFEQMTIIDLSKDIVHMANKYFSNINDNVSEMEDVSMLYTDGRNFLMLNDEKFDLISMEISSIWFAGAATLYNKEFYELVDDSLSDNGVLQQWVQLHRISLTDIFYIINTVRSVFPNIWLFEIGGQGIIVASKKDISPNQASIDKLYSTPTLKPFLDLYDGSEEILNGCLLDPTMTTKLLASYDGDSLISTDDNMFLEYSTPKGNVRPYVESIRENIGFLKQLNTEGCTIL